jgi:hypothetical protein
VGFNRLHGERLITYIQALFSEDLSIYENQPRSEFFVRLIAPVVHFTPDYWIAGLYLSFLSFLCFWSLIRVVSERYPQNKWTLYFAFAFFPSVIIWSSGILKDTIANGALALLVALTLQFYWNRKLNPLVVLLLLTSIWVLASIKFYALGIWVTGSMLLLTTSLPYKWKASLYIGILILGWIFMRFLHPWMSVERLPLTIYENHQQILAISDPNSIISFPGFVPSYPSMIINLLPASIYGLYRPFLWEHGEWISLYVRIENMVLILLSLWSATQWRKFRRNPEIWIGLFCIMILSAFITLATPNIGSLARYRSIYLPYFVFIIGIIPLKNLHNRWL